MYSGSVQSLSCRPVNVHTPWKHLDDNRFGDLFPGCQTGIRIRREGLSCGNRAEWEAAWVRLCSGAGDTETHALAFPREPLPAQTLCHLSQAP